jgi:hypothetical protein
MPHLMPDSSVHGKVKWWEAVCARHAIQPGVDMTKHVPPSKGVRKGLTTRMLEVCEGEGAIGPSRIGNCPRGVRTQAGRQCTRLNLIGAVAGSDGLVRVGVGGRTGRSRFDPRHVCLGRVNCFFLGLAGFV